MRNVCAEAAVLLCEGVLFIIYCPGWLQIFRFLMSHQPPNTKFLAMRYSGRSVCMHFGGSLRF